MTVLDLIAKLAGKYKMIFYKSHNLSIPDALIAASAKISNAILVAKNIKHFQWMISTQ